MGFDKIMYLVGFALMMALNLLRYRVYHTTRARAVAYTLVTYVYGVGGAVAMAKIYTAVCRALGTLDGSSVAIFGAVIFCPLLILATVGAEKLVRRLTNGAGGKKKPQHAPKKNAGKKKAPDPISARNTMDLLTPGIFIILACAKFGCHFMGCCYGVSSSWGVFNPLLQDTRFPVQMFEFATMCVIILLCFFLKTKPFYRRGMAYPLTAALYAVARFGWECKRFYVEELRHIVFGLTFWQFCCVVVFVASAVSLAVLYKTQPGEPLPGLTARRPTAGSR